MTMKPKTKHITPVAIIVLRNESGAFLMTDRVERDPLDAGVVVGDDFWQLPGGGIEIGESVEDAAVREGKEELGLDLEAIGTLPKIYTALRSHWHGLLIPVLCKQIDPTQEIRLNHESSIHQWVQLDQASALNSFPETFDIMKRAHEYSSLTSGLYSRKSF